MNIKSLIKGSLLALTLTSASFSTNAHAVTIGWHVVCPPAWVYVWAQNVGSASGTINQAGYYSWNMNVPSGTFVQLTCQSACNNGQVAMRVYSNHYLRC